MTRKLRHTNLVGRSEDARIEHKFLMRPLQAQFNDWAHKDLFAKQEMFIDELAQQQEKGEPRFQIFRSRLIREPMAWRAIQGHSRSMATEENIWALMDIGYTRYLWHGTYRRHMDSIVRGGIDPWRWRPKRKDRIVLLAS